MILLTCSRHNPSMNSGLGEFKGKKARTNGSASTRFDEPMGESMANPRMIITASSFMLRKVLDGFAVPSRTVCARFVFLRVCLGWGGSLLLVGCGAKVADRPLSFGLKIQKTSFREIPFLLHSRLPSSLFLKNCDGQRVKNIDKKGRQLRDT